MYRGRDVTYFLASTADSDCCRQIGRRIAHPTVDSQDCYISNWNSTHSSHAEKAFQRNIACSPVSPTRPHTRQLSCSTATPRQPINSSAHPGLDFPSCKSINHTHTSQLSRTIGVVGTSRNGFDKTRYSHAGQFIGSKPIALATCRGRHRHRRAHSCMPQIDC